MREESNTRRDIEARVTFVGVWSDVHVRKFTGVGMQGARGHQCAWGVHVSV